MWISRYLVVFPFILLNINTISAQTNNSTSSIITTSQQLSRSIKAHPYKRLVDLNTFIYRIIIDMPYSTPANVTHTILYPKPIAYMREPAAEALLFAHLELNKLGLELKIYDAYRPLSVTRKIWDVVQDSRYAANPATGSGHNRALSVDLTLVDIRTGEELDMGTGFDNFTDTAYHTFTHLPETVLNNRGLLKVVMEEHGFVSLSTEWWHYSWPNTRGWEILDLDFDGIAAGLK